MDENLPLPTPYQKRLVNIAFVIQFYLAALGHLAMWCYMYWSLFQPSPPDDIYDEGKFVTEIFVYQGIPISFGFLVAVYILFRCLLAYTGFSTALKWMIGLDVVHSILLLGVVITPVRLLIPIILYSVAFRSYCNNPVIPNDITKQVVEEESP